MPCCLIRDKIEIEIYFEVGDKFEGPNNEKRFYYYGSFVKQFYDEVLAKGNHIELLVYFEIAVKNRYLEDDIANYVGIKTAVENLNVRN